MKKFLVIALACICLLPIFGCSEKIQFVGSKDTKIRADERLCKVGTTGKISVYNSVYNFSEPLVEGKFDTFGKFKRFYKNIIKDNVDGAFYLIDPGERADDGIGCTGYPTMDFHVYVDGEKDGKYKNPIIYEEFSLYEDQFHPSDYDYDIIGGDNTSITMQITLKPLKSTKSNKFRFEFGDDKELKHLYTNIYCGDECFATCVYWLYTKHPKTDLTYEWFEEYFKEHIVLD